MTINACNLYYVPVNSARNRIEGEEDDNTDIGTHSGLDHGSRGTIRGQEQYYFIIPHARPSP